MFFVPQDQMRKMVTTERNSRTGYSPAFQSKKGDLSFLFIFYFLSVILFVRGERKKNR
jgi:hypothetical protein